MPDVFVIFDDSKIDPFLKEHSSSIAYVCFGKKNKHMGPLLDDPSLEEISLSIESASKDYFVRKYIDFIGKLSAVYNTHYWWLTSISAKNPFGTTLFSDIFDLWVLVNKIESQKKDILIIDPPENLLPSLKEYCNNNSINIKVFKKKKLLPVLKRSIRSKAMNCAQKPYFVYSLTKKKYMATRLFKKKWATSLKNNDYYVLRSWFYPRSVENGYYDSFFGPLPKHLHKRKMNLLIVAGIWDNYTTTAKKMVEINDYFIIPQEFFMRYADPFRTIINVFMNRIKVKGKFEFEGIDVSTMLKKAIEIEFSGRNVLENHIHYYYMKGLLRKVNVHTFTNTYENYPWEKMCIYSIKEMSPDTFTIGYQHSRISYADLTLYISDYEKDVMISPDRINTTGKITKLFFEKYGNYDKEKLYESCALRSDGILSNPILQKRTGNILIALGGIPSRAIETLNLIHGGLKNRKDINLILRCHPALPFDKFKDKLNFDFSSWKQLIPSTNNDLIDDLEKVCMVIYDASTISLEALSMGIPIVHIVLDDIISFDPVIECDSLKWVVKDKNELSSTIDMIQTMNIEDFERQQHDAREYVKDYLHPITECRLDKFIAGEKHG